MRNPLVDRYGIRPTAMFVAGCLAVAIIFVFLVWAEGKAEEECKASGGHRETHYSHGVTSDGKTFTVTETECVHDQPR